MTPLAGQPVDVLVRRIGAPDAPPAASSAAALAGALAAGALAKAARASKDSWDQAGGAVAQAEALARRLEGLADTVAEAHRAAMAALLDHPGDGALGAALARAAEAALAVAMAGADLAELGAFAAPEVVPARRADAVAAAMIAAGVVRAAAHMVDVNLAARARPDLVEGGLAACRRADAAVETALEATVR